MSKSVYSLVLNDEVVAEVDRLAYRNGTNRSDMITRILAEAVSVSTPEKQTRDILKRIETLLSGGDTFRLMMQPSGTMMSLRSALSYKYNPTVRYSVELYCGESPTIGQLRVTLRTQNSSLIACMQSFCRFWMQTEDEYIGQCQYEMEDGRFSRELTLRINPAVPVQKDNAETLGDLIFQYIRVFDRCLKTYFYHLDNPTLAASEIRRLYREYVNTGAVL